MQVIALDFETFFGDDYTLKKMTTEEYIRDPRFRAHGCSIEWPDGTAEWYTHEEFLALIPQVDWSSMAVVAHHAHFDGLILSHHYGVIPGFWGDTLALGRYLHGSTLGGSLAALAKHYGLDPKNVPYDLFRNKRWEELTLDEQRLVAEGCIHDTRLTKQLFNLMRPKIIDEELIIIDMTVRMFTEPSIVGDQVLLGKVWLDETQKKLDALRELNVDPKELSSSNRFAELLRNEGVEPPTKVTPKGNTIFAFAKTDDAMRELLDDENPRIAALCAARLGEKSTIGQTRAARLGNMAMRGAMPVYLNYVGAHTRRWSGGDKSNWQNFKRGSDLRKSILAPDGYDLGIVDEEQIECRVLNFVAGQFDILQKFADKQDVYSELASKFYGRPIDKSQPKERGVGKQIELSCGYGSGGKTIVQTARRGTYGPPVVLSIAEGEALKNLYRITHPGVTDYWKQGDRILPVLSSGGSMQWGCLWVEDHKLFAPNGLYIDYSTLKYEQDERRWTLRTKRGRVNMWGGVITQNVCELLSRIILSQAMLRVRELGVKVLLCTHDDTVSLIPRKFGQPDTELFDQVKAAHAIEPEWLPGIPLSVEGMLSQRYEK